MPSSHESLGGFPEISTGVGSDGSKVVRAAYRALAALAIVLLVAGPVLAQEPKKPTYLTPAQALSYMEELRREEAARDEAARLEYEKEKAAWAVAEAGAARSENRVIAGDLPGLIADGVNVETVCRAIQYQLRGETYEGRLRVFTPEERAAAARTCAYHAYVRDLEAKVASAAAEIYAARERAKAAEADAKREAARDWKPLSKETEKAMKEGPRGGGYYGGYYGDDSYDRALERQQRDRDRAEDRAQAEADRRAERREADRQLEATRQLRDAVESENARRRGQLPSSRLEGYHQ